ncbi:unnamed protein product, partial [Phaeothamnion confervicola]
LPFHADLCPFVDDTIESVKRGLATKIIAQPMATEALLGAIQQWDFARSSGKPEPLVVAITGPTGVGKTETAWVLAESILARRVPHRGGSAEVPRGFLIFRGEDFAADETLLATYKAQIKVR